MASATSVIVLSPMSALAKVKMNVRTEVDLSLPQVHTYVYAYPGEKERVRARFIVENTRFLHQISRVLPHGTAPNRLFPVRSKTKLRKERFDSVRVRTFGY